MILCPVCKGQVTEKICVSPVAEKYSYCLDCKSIFLTDLSQININVYDAQYVSNLAYNENYHKLFKFYEPTFCYNIGKKVGKFLEVGFSNPSILLYLKHQGWDVTGLDVVCPIKKRLEDLGIRIIESDVLKASIPDTYDIIWMSHVIEHFTVDGLKTVLRSLNQKLTSNGVLFIAAPDASLYGGDRTDALLANLKPKEHMVLYTKETFYKIAQECGYKRLWMQTYTDPLPGRFEYQTKFEWRMCLAKA
jgi:2-polyprenyl-3-methyl-5-hydroxy-6-metoxy-1,4-benzoquinol methylase